MTRFFTSRTGWPPHTPGGVGRFVPDDESGSHQPHRVRHSAAKALLIAYALPATLLSTRKVAPAIRLWRRGALQRSLMVPDTAQASRRQLVKLTGFITREIWIARSSISRPAQAGRVDRLRRTAINALAATLQKRTAMTCVGRRSPTTRAPAAYSHRRCRGQAPITTIRPSPLRSGCGPRAHAADALRIAHENDSGAVATALLNLGAILPASTGTSARQRNPTARH